MSRQIYPQKDLESLQQGSLHSDSLREILSKTNFTQIKNDSNQGLMLSPISQSKTSVQGIEFKVKNNYLMTSYENKKKIILAFACAQSHQSLQKTSKIILWQFKKQDGQNSSMQINGIKGTISSMRIGIVQHIEQKWLEQSKDDKKVKYSICLILGTIQGYLKRIYLRKDYSIKSMKLSTSNPIRQILPFNSQFWQQNVFFFILLDNNQIILINLLNFDIICKFHPPILYSKAEYALNISLSLISQDLLFQSTKGGYLIIWEFSNKNLHQNIQASSKNEFKRKNVLQMVFPKFLSHELSLNGFLYMQTFGKMILIVDKKCVLKLVSINLEDRTDFIEIFKIQLPYFQNEQNQTFHQTKIPQESDILYNEKFQSTFLNFRFFQTQMTLYFILEKEKHSVYKLKLNQFMECQSLQRLKIRNKHFKSIDQFIISEDRQFLIVRNENYFTIKYFGQEEDGAIKSQQEENQKDDQNRQRSKQKKDKKSQRSQRNY